jgi:hypothetical protein
MTKQEKGADQERRRFLARVAQLGLLTASIPAITLALPRRSAARGCPGPVLGGGPAGGGTVHVPKPKKAKLQQAEARKQTGAKASDGDHNRY